MFDVITKAITFTSEHTRFLVSQILLMMEHMHNSRIIYRDLKPENVILDSEGHLKLTDFGLSKLQASSEQRTYTFCGTPEYLAPEIVKGAGHNHGVDWWSLVRKK